MFPIWVEQVNRLLDYNQEVVERQRTHVGNLAHALKTPLSVMLTEANQQPGQLAGRGGGYFTYLRNSGFLFSLKARPPSLLSSVS